MSHIPTALFLLTILSNSAVGQRQIVVGGPGADYAELPPVVQAANSGDTILVNAGDYTATKVDKGLQIVADPGARLAYGGQHAGLLVEDATADNPRTGITIRNC